MKQSYKIFFRIFLILMIIFSLSSCFGKERDHKNNDNIRIVEKNKTKNNKEFKSEIDKLLTNGNYLESINLLEKKGIENLDDTEKKALMVSYLRYGNSYYKEIENSEKAMNLLNKMEDTPEVLYYKGYANEILKNYSGALKHYDNGLKTKDLTDEWKATFIAQIGHVYDLKGQKENAYKNYKKAYSIKKSNTGVNLMLGRYYIKNGELNKAKDILENIVKKVDNKFIKAEIYYNLSTLYFYLDDKTGNNYQKSIDYAQKSIDTNQDYPNGYIGVARVLIYLGGKSKDAEELLNNVLVLHPNNSSAYKFLGMIELSKGEYKKAIEYFRKSKENIGKDIILFAGEKNFIYGEVNYYLAISSLGLNKKEDAITYLKESIKYKNMVVLNLFFKEIIKSDYGNFKELKGVNGFDNFIENLKKEYNL